MIYSMESFLVVSPCTKRDNRHPDLDFLADSPEFHLYGTTLKHTGLDILLRISGTPAIILVNVSLDFKYLGPDSKNTVLASGICL